MGIIYKESVYIASVKINSRRRSNIFFKPIRISRSSHSTTTIKLRFSSFHSLPPLSSQGSGRFSVLSQTCSLLVRREGGGGGQERLGKRRADKRGQGEGSTRLDYFYTRHADLLGADLEPRSSLLVFP